MSLIDYVQVLAVINGNDDPPAALEAFVAQETEHAAYVATRAAELAAHRCHLDPLPNGVHALVCPTGQHPGGWVHPPGPHKMCKDCG